MNKGKFFKDCTETAIGCLIRDNHCRQGKDPHVPTRPRSQASTRTPQQSDMHSGAKMHQDYCKPYLPAIRSRDLSGPIQLTRGLSQVRALGMSHPVAKLHRILQGDPRKRALQGARILQPARIARHRRKRRARTEPRDVHCGRR